MKQWSNFYSYWGKTEQTEQGVRCHLLPFHALDVVAVADSWLEHSPVLSRFLMGNTQNRERYRGWLLFFIALHDLGKFDFRFQRKADSAWSQLNDHFDPDNSDPAASRGFDHGKAGYAWWLSEAIIAGFTSEDNGSAWMEAVAKHHGALDPSGIAELYDLDADSEVIEHDRQARSDWIEALVELFLLSNGCQRDEIPLPFPLLAGFCSVCDWIGSNEKWFGWEESPKSLYQYYEERKSQAGAALIESGLIGHPLSHGGMSVLYPYYQPRGVQYEVNQLDTAPSLLLIEAPTGSGKTEAALTYASTLMAAGLVESLLFALPTQATANAMLGRLEEVAPRLFPGQASNIVLAHGKSRYNLQFAALKESATNGRGEESAQLQCTNWLASSRKRVFLGQIGVCTIDQVLLSVLPVRHNFVRGFGVGRSVLIVDEVHAYDSYMNGLLGEVIKQQYDAGGSVVLLSATLSDALRCQLVRAWGHLHIEPVEAYPLLTHVTDGINEVPAADPAPERTVNHLLWVQHDLLPDRNNLREVVEAAQQGARVAVICNLVADAQQIYAALKALGGELRIDLFHSRFTFVDRQRCELEAMKVYGKGSEATGAILVATQVVEQSLDLDFDWMVTQLCPVDLLFQRLGRLHRHQRQRPPGFEQPKVTVLVPSALEFGGHGVVYGNHRALWRTWKLLERSTEIHFPVAYREWINAVYGVGDEAEQPWEDEPAEITAQFQRYQNEEEGKRFGALSVASSVMNPYEDRYDHAAALTRDGEMSIPLCLLQAGGALLDGTWLNQLEDWDQSEAIDRNSVSVPASWNRPQASLLPEQDLSSGLRMLRLKQKGQSWTGETERARYVYTQTRGLEMERKGEAV